MKIWKRTSEQVWIWKASGVAINRKRWTGGHGFTSGVSQVNRTIIWWVSKLQLGNWQAYNTNLIKLWQIEHDNIYVGITTKNKYCWVQLHLCLKSPSWDRYTVCHPTVLSCKQLTFALSIMHDISNIYNHVYINTAILPLVATTHPRP